MQKLVWSTNLKGYITEESFNRRDSNPKIFNRLKPMGWPTSVNQRRVNDEEALGLIAANAGAYEADVCILGPLNDLIEPAFYPVIFAKLAQRD